ncbi:MAG: hypothetical protein HLX50_00685 [Alteromonadaceae bacterium]|nr:hypothetical protein [Alteromonadaceae bacterium]
MELSNITTQTHRITAQYTFTPGTDTIDIDTKGDTLQDVVTDMLDFLNGFDEIATPFALDPFQEPADLSDFSLEIIGEVFAENDDNPHGENDVIPMYVTITAQER